MIITLLCFRLDGFPQRMWMKKECSKSWMFAGLAPFKSGTIFYCSQRKITHSSRKITKKFLLDTPLSTSASTLFLYPQLCISFASVCTFLYVQDVLFNFCTGKKKKLSCCLSASVCSEEVLLNWGHSRNWLWIALLWKRLPFVAGLCEVK